MVEYRMTVVKIGLGFASAESVAAKCEGHMAEMATGGWRLVHADRNSFSIPCYWSFIWERAAGAPTENRV